MYVYLIVMYLRLLCGSRHEHDMTNVKEYQAHLKGPVTL